MTDSTKYHSKLANARVLIIGGTSGIGFGSAEITLEHAPTSTVLLSSSVQSKIDNAISRLEKSYPSAVGRVHGKTVDLSNDETMESQISELLQWATSNGTKQLDHLIFTAGDSVDIRPLAENTLAQVKRSGNVRYFAPLMFATAIAKHNFMNISTQSSFTITSGVSGVRPIPHWAVYCGYLAGLQGLTRSLALDMKPIRVNLITPGPVETEMWDGFPVEQRKVVMDSLERSTATGKVGRVEDLAESYLHCMRDANMTGSWINSDGGTLLLGPY
ncbi:NAD(P)-binding protein [Karstenula rhodostoma CBS 690.94]|uniref:NAD(P)-binding protein n=1 Tax=Karstenula rhodostoma CBS 690.94 TaxID=1392251 RepID=A0A9P4U593_9PLEO|nr:NAD(P)-binding protein [Karstenula rhodostoma CBS 690.94]